MIKEINYSLSQKFPGLIGKTIWIDEKNIPNNLNYSPTVESYLNILNALDYDLNRIATAEQIHCDKVLYTDDPGIFGECDGLITHSFDLYLLIRTADCASIFIYDANNKIIANLHAGWRGLHKNIILNGLNIFFKKYQSNPTDIFIQVSPFIKSCCYQVGKKFLKLFSPEFIIYRQEKIFLDLQELIFQQLIWSGVPKKQICMSDICTKCDPLRLPSYRRTKTKNRMFNLLILNR